MSTVGLSRRADISKLYSCSWGLTSALVSGEELMTIYLCRIAFVRQEDLFFSQLTVRETLSLAAELQLPDLWAPERKESYVNDLLFRLGLVRASILASVSRN
jgi:ABC-type multidrug transport system ATPase subunit